MVTMTFQEHINHVCRHLQSEKEPWTRQAASSPQSGMGTEGSPGVGEKLGGKASPGGGTWAGIGPDSAGDGDGWHRAKRARLRQSWGDRVSWQLGARFTGVRK